MNIPVDACLISYLFSKCMVNRMVSSNIAKSFARDHTTLSARIEISSFSIEKNEGHAASLGGRNPRDDSSTREKHLSISSL